MKLTLVLLASTAVVVVCHPYLPYHADTENTLITEEEVAAYLNSKMDKEKTESEAIAEYVESLIQSKKKSECWLMA